MKATCIAVISRCAQLDQRFYTLSCHRCLLCCPPCKKQAKLVSDITHKSWYLYVFVSFVLLSYARHHRQSLGPLFIHFHLVTIRYGKVLFFLHLLFLWYVYILAVASLAQGFLKSLRKWVNRYRTLTFVLYHHANPRRTTKEFGLQTPSPSLTVGQCQY